MGSDDSFSVSPNPAKDIITVKTEGKAGFSLIDISGKILITKDIQDIGTIDVSAYLPGIYIIKNNSTGTLQRIIVTK